MWNLASLQELINVKLGYAAPDPERPPQQWERPFILLRGVELSKPISEC